MMVEGEEGRSAAGMAGKVKTEIRETRTVLESKIRKINTI
jgi:hypothetical protein